MLNNKQVFDVLTPMSDFHRVTHPIATNVTDSTGANTYDVELNAIPGKWVKVVNEGVVGFTFGGAGSVGDSFPGLEVLCLSRSIGSSNALSSYEANDVKVGSITAVRTPGLRVMAGSFFFKDGDISTLQPGNALVPVAYDGTNEDQVGRLEFTNTAGVLANALVEHVNIEGDYVIYEIGSIKV